MSNNDVSFTATLAYQAAHVDITIAITTDQYGSETTWDIKTSSGASISSGGPYADGAVSVQAPVIATLSPDECYTFTIYDSYGDGICCNYGQGSYSVTDGNAYSLASGGQFTDEKSAQFRTGISSPSSIEETNIVEKISIYPNPVNDIATLSFTTTEKSKTVISITNILGEIVYLNEIGKIISGQHIMPISTSEITEGLYFVNLITSNRIITKKITIVK